MLFVTMMLLAWTGKRGMLSTMSIPMSLGRLSLLSSLMMYLLPLTRRLFGGLLLKRR